MSTDSNRMTDAFHMAMEKARSLPFDGLGIVGYGVIEHRDQFGRLIDLEPFSNIITNYGDEYYSKMGVALVQPQNNAAPTLVSKMKLGTGTTAPSKSAATNEVIETYKTGSVQSFDSSYPQTADIAGNNTGWNATYKVTWAAGTATDTALTEATITSSTADGQGAATDTIARVTFTAVNKGASDTLAITWSHKFLGA